MLAFGKSRMKKNHLSLFFASLLPVLALSSCSAVDYSFPDDSGNFLFPDDKQIAKKLSQKATLAMAEGNIAMAISLAEQSLRKEPKDPYTLMLVGVAYDISGSPAKAKRFYEDVIALDAGQVSLIGNLRNIPPLPMKEVAKRRLADIENPSHSAQGEEGQKEPIKKSLLPEDVFKEGDKNAVSRFLLFKRLAEEGLITKAEFAQRRNNNVGALLPNTKNPPAVGLDRPAPSADDIIARLGDLRDAFYQRAITAKDHETERTVIIDAILPLNVSERMLTVQIPRDLLSGASALRRLNIIYELGLITDEEKVNEAKAIEQSVKTGLAKGRGFDTLSAVKESKDIEVKPIADPVISKPKALVKTKQTTQRRRAPGVVTGRAKN